MSVRIFQEIHLSVILNELYFVYDTHSKRKKKLYIKIDGP